MIRLRRINKTFEQLVCLSVLLLSSASAKAEGVAHAKYWSHDKEQLFGHPNEMKVGSNQCALLGHFEYEKKGARHLYWLQGFRDGESVRSFNWKAGVEEKHITSQTDSFGSTQTTDTYTPLSYNWWEIVSGYALNPGCTLVLNTEQAFAGKPEIVVPGVKDQTLWTGTENYTELNIITAATVGDHPTRGGVKSLTCLCLGNAPTPVAPNPADIRDIEAVAKGPGAYFRRRIVEVGQELEAELAKVKTLFQTFQDSYLALGDTNAVLDRLASTQTAVAADELATIDRLYRDFVNESCSSKLSDAYRHLQETSSSGKQMIDSFRAQYSDRQDGTSDYRDAVAVFAKARKLLTKESKGLRTQRSQYLTSCQRVSQVLDAVVNRYRYEKFTALNQQFAHISSQIIDALAASNKKLEALDAVHYWDLQFSEQLKELMRLRRAHHYKSLIDLRMNMAGSLEEFYSSIKADSRLAGSRADQLVDRYSLLMVEEQRLCTEKLQLGVKTLVKSRANELFENDLLRKVRLQISGSEDEQKPALLLTYVDLIRNAGFELPTSCDSVATATSTAACWKLVFTPGGDAAIYENYDKNLNALELTLNDNFFKNNQ